MTDVVISMLRLI